MRLVLVIAVLGKYLYDLIASILPQGYQVRREDPLTLVDSEPEPDISVVLASMPALFRSHPTTAELVIEVSVSSPELDRANISLYAEARVKEYWIVLAHDRQVEVYRDPRQGAYAEKQVFGNNDLIECKAVPKILVCVADLFREG